MTFHVHAAARPHAARVSRVLAAALVLPAGTAQALTVNVRDGGTQFFQLFGTPLSSPDVSSSSLLDIVNAAGDYWEQLILDPMTLTIETGFSRNLQSNVLAAEATTGITATTRSAAIAFNVGADWFADATPLDHAEYSQRTETRLDLGGGELLAGYVFDGGIGAAFGTFDLFSTALHEIGHALGLDAIFADSYPFPNILVADPLPFAGSVIPYDSAHIPLGGALMDFSTGSGERTLPSDVDILAIAMAGGYTQVQMNATTVPLPSALWLFGAGLAALATRRARPLPAAA